jgi:hypothetical protein
MGFNDEVRSKKRRSTAEINERFRKFLTSELSACLGVQISDRMAISLLKRAVKAPMRFLMTLDEKEFNQYGERDIAVSGVGRFVIKDTVASGGRLDLVGEGKKYPRYKFYPSNIVCSEVEILNGLESEYGREVYDRSIDSEKDNDGKNVEEMVKIVKKVMKELNPNFREKDVRSLVKEVVKETSKLDIKNVKKVVGQEIERMLEKYIGEDVIGDKIISSSSEKSIDENDYKGNESEFKTESESKTESVIKAIDSFDFDFNT